jgi:hypothetical protein
MTHQPSFAHAEFAAKKKVTRREQFLARREAVNAGTLDGYKDMSLDGWSNLEKFRCRSNPLKTASPPVTVELLHTTGLAISKAISRQSDLPFELHLEVRTNSAISYQDIETQPTAFYSALNYLQANEQKNFDLHISWRVSQRKSYEPGDPNYTETPSPEKTIESLEGKANLKIYDHCCPV